MSQELILGPHIEQNTTSYATRSVVIPTKVKQKLNILVVRIPHGADSTKKHNFGLVFIQI